MSELGHRQSGVITLKSILFLILNLYLNSSDQNSYYLLASTQLLPQFCLYRLLSQNPKLDFHADLDSLRSGVFFIVHERPQRVS